MAGRITTQTYGEGFAAIYDMRWAGYANQFVPDMIALLERNEFSISGETVVCDLCCGTGHVSLLLAEQGCKVYAVDKSEAMLNRCRTNNAQGLESARVTVSKQLAQSYELPEPVDLTVALYDSLNHLESVHELENAVQSVTAATKPGGMFIFDLNTRKGLRRWNGVSIEDKDEWLLISRGVYSEDMPRAYTALTGFVRDEDEWKRFSEIMYNTPFEIEVVKQLLHGLGWEGIQILSAADLSPVHENPETHDRVFVLAKLTER